MSIDLTLDKYYIILLYYYVTETCPNCSKINKKFEKCAQVVG